jgi:hypothetical protein
MALSRLFIAQEALDAWVTEGRAEVSADELLDRKTGMRFRIRPGLRFVSEVSGAVDAPGLVGKVKDLEQVAALRGEYMADSVILGDNAYTVQQGFVGAPIAAESSMFSSAPPVLTPEPPPAAQRQTIAALQAFFLNNVK